MEKVIVGAVLNDRTSLELIPPGLELSSVARKIIELAKDYYDKDPKQAYCDREVMWSRIPIKFEVDSEMTAAWDYLDQVPKMVSIPNLKEDIRGYQKTQALQHLKNAVSVGKDEDISQAIDDYQSLGAEASGSSDERVWTNISIEDLVNNHFSEAGEIKLLPTKLNELCDGGARPGHHIIVYARPEIGKTLVVQNMVAGFLRQNLKVLYCCNEDPDSVIIIRQTARLIRKSRAWVKANPKEAGVLANEKGLKNLVVAGLTPGNFRQIRRLVKQHSPQVLVLDQLRNIQVDSEGTTQRLEAAATEARNLGKQFNMLVVSVTQAGDSAENRSILGMSDIDSSKTGIPAQGDLLVAIGADAGAKKRGIRTITTPKNKLGGKHESFTFTIDNDTGEVLNAQ